MIQKLELPQQPHHGAESSRPDQAADNIPSITRERVHALHGSVIEQVCYRNLRRASWTLGARRSLCNEAGATALDSGNPLSRSAFLPHRTQGGVSYVQLAHFTVDRCGSVRRAHTKPNIGWIG
jgi:hypothetical protein